MKGTNFAATVGMILLIVGGLNWGLVGVFHFDLIRFLFGDMTLVTRLVYTLVGIAAIGIGFWMPTVAPLGGWCGTKSQRPT
jgi:uncharacterized protein